MQIAQTKNQSTQNNVPSKDQLSEMGARLGKLAWKDGDRNNETGYVAKVEQMALKSEFSEIVNKTFLAEIEKDVRGSVNVPESYSLVNVKFRMLRDGGTQFVTATFYDKDSGQALALSTSKKFGGVPESEAWNMDEKRILGDYEIMRQISQNMLGIDKLKDVDIKRTEQGGGSSFTFSSKDQGILGTVDFDRSGKASVKKAEFDPSDFGAAFKANTNLDTVVDLQQLAARNAAGEYIVEKGRLDVIKDQIRKSLNIPEAYKIGITPLDGESAIIEREGMKFIGGLVTKPGSDQRLPFLYCITDKTLTLGSTELVERTKVPQRLDELFKGK